MGFTPTTTPPGTDPATAASVQADNNAQLQNESITKVYRDSAGIDRIIIGRLPDGKHGMKVSKEGKDVLTAADSDLNFNSQQNVFKIVKTGTGTIPGHNFQTSANSYGSSLSFTFPISVPIAHNLGYVPAILAFANFSSYRQLPWHMNGGNGSNYYVQFDFSVAVDSTNVYLLADAFGYNVTSPGIDSPAIPVKYFLLQETAS